MMRYVIPVLLWSALATAAPARRFAVVVGANRGDEGDQPLKFAEADARRVARVLGELGGFRDVVELKTPTATELDAALEKISREIAAEKNPPLVMFYYSGHADGDALHIGGARFTLDRLRTWLRDSRAGVRLAVLDSCHSGALTRVKGMHAQPAIEVRLADEITTRGEALLTSSTSDEQARESDALRGSFFTHHLVSGLRGAADRSKDGRVTLAEAYDYAYGKTVAQARGGQHPTFKYDLAGRGDVVLTSLEEGGAWLAFGDDARGLYYIFSDDGTLLGDVDVGGPLKVALAPGRYELRKGNRALRVVLSKDEVRRVHDEELQPIAVAAREKPKGGILEPDYDALPVEPPPPPPSDLVSPAELSRIERARTQKQYNLGTGLLVGGVASLVPLAITFGVGLGPMSEWNAGSLAAAMIPTLAEMMITSTTLITVGGVLMRSARLDQERGVAVALTRAEVEDRQRARSEHKRRLGHGLFIGGMCAMFTALPYQIAAFAIGNNSSNIVEHNALHSTAVASLTMGVVLSAVGGQLRKEARRELGLDGGGGMTLSPLAFSGGGGLGFSGNF